LINNILSPPAFADCRYWNFASGDFEDRSEKYLATLTGIARGQNYRRAANQPIVLASQDHRDRIPAL
jgi:hypothetical protein